MGGGSGRQNGPDELGSALADTVTANRSATDPSGLPPPASSHDTGDGAVSTYLSLFNAIAATPDLPPPLDLRAGELIDGTYRVEGKLGAGGMGVVYLASDQTLERQVALKIQRPLSADDSTARLVREAQAMARLEHPNVLSVYEVGTYREHVFIAMAYVAGGTLRSWLKETPRTPSEIIALFAQAGRGLAAAHTAGLVHRDFKPDNVLVTASGRALVGDFGLARRAGDDAPDSVPGLFSSPDGSSARMRLTATGACIGTPAYMAPEQHAGAAVDAAADQFGFCAALYEALYHRLPFKGSSPRELAQSMRAGPARVPRQRGVPARVRAALARGLSLDPSARFPTMNALVEQLDRALRPRRWPVVLAAAAIVCAGSAAAVWATWGGSDPCATSGQEARAIWERQQPAIDAAFVAAGPALTTTASTVDHHLDDYARHLADFSRQSCRRARATRDELSDRFAECVGVRRDALRALVNVLAHADRHVAQRAPLLAAQLPALEPCNDTQYLAAQVKPPADPAVAAEVDQLRRRLAEARLKAVGGLASRDDKVADEVLARAEKLGYDPLISDALLIRGLLLQSADKFNEAEATMRRAYFTAVRSGDDEQAAEAAKDLVNLLASDDVRAKDASFWADQAEAEIARFGGDSTLHADVVGSRALVAETAGDYAGALKLWLKAIDLLRAARADNTTAMAQALSSAGVAYDLTGEFDKSTDYYARSLAMLERLLGKDHPLLINVISNKGLVDDERGDHDLAIAEQRRALALAIQYDGPDDLETGYQHLNLGTALYGAEKHDEAMAELEKAKTIIEAKEGADHPDMSLVLNTMAVTYEAKHDYDKALTTLRQAQAIVVARQGADHPKVAVVRDNVADVLIRQHKPKEALAEAEKAIAIQTKAKITGSVLATSLTLQGWALVELGQARRAVPPLEQALELFENKTGDLDRRGDCHYWLARALHDLHTGGARPAKLATEAADLYRQAGDEVRSNRAKTLAQTLASH